MPKPTPVLNLGAMQAFAERVQREPNAAVRRLLWGILNITDYNDQTSFHPLMVPDRDLFYRTYQDFQGLVEQYGENTNQVRDAVRTMLGKESLERASTMPPASGVQQANSAMESTSPGSFDPTLFATPAEQSACRQDSAVIHRGDSSQESNGNPESAPLPSSPIIEIR